MIIIDKLYIGDIPNDYHYAVFSNDYITLYNRPSATNTTLNYYRVYINIDGFMYSTGTTSFPQYNTTYFQDIPVSNDWKYRRDFGMICLTSFVFVIFFVFLFNIVTSIYRKGGVFGGLF